ncbi:hypothetical protein AGMMS50267_00610 [Spirochaetia bacterium]|nr:hypothetical protein AGMMS50267_00610 [Spirochaetia bacterium]
MNKRLTRSVLPVLSMAMLVPLCAVLLSTCAKPLETADKTFTKAPALTLSPVAGGLAYTWTDSEPGADSCDLYYVQGQVSNVNTLKAGTKIENAVSGGTIDSLTGEAYYSVLVTANKTGYVSVDSPIKQKQAGSGKENFNPGDPDENTFTTVPVLTLAPASGGLTYTWTASDPAADSYDVYYVPGQTTDAAAVKAGTKIPGAASGGTVTGLTGGAYYSVLVTANKADYPGVDSAIKQRQINDNTFTAAPEVTLTPGVESLTYTWTASNPSADSYDVYWAAGQLSNANTLKAGTKITGAASGGTISGLSGGAYYSVLVTANKASYSSEDSAIRQGQTDSPPAAPPPPKTKRGAAYSFTTGNNTPAQDMALLKSGTGINWFYNWGINTPANVNTAAVNAGLPYIPMAWNSVDTAKLRAYKAAHPDVEYLLAFNEPNLTDQANMTPAQAAAKWPQVKAIAAELNLKIVSPAMNWGTLANYSDPVVWLDEFFAQPGVSIHDISAISIHCYMQYTSAVKSFIEKFYKYNKPIWVTEFCGWEDLTQITNATRQMEYMSNTVTLMELDPAVERYAWFIPKGAGNTGNTAAPYNKLINDTNPPTLTDLGTVYVNMGAADPGIWASKDQQIEAEHFTGNNLADWIGVSGYAKSVVLRPTTDSSGGLDIYGFTKESGKDGMWVAYQVDLVGAGTKISLRYQTTASTSLQISVDGSLKSTVTLNSAGWTTKEQALAIPAGKHTIRLKIANSGNLALNWLKIE